MQRLASLLVHALQLALHHQREAAAMRNLAQTDPLTGLHNRRGFLTLAQQQLKQAKRSGRRMVLLFADVDGLKRINDLFGHLVGDQVLRNAAAILRQTFRDSDIIARVGGDEFVVLASEAHDRSLHGLAARLEKNLRAHRHEPGGAAVSLSIGSVPCTARCCASLERLLEQADQAMYSGRRSRRVADRTAAGPAASGPHHDRSALNGRAARGRAS
jgi:diguanylate cyclase (GGDEF)-like protein